MLCIHAVTQQARVLSDSGLRVHLHCSNEAKGNEDNLVQHSKDDEFPGTGASNQGSLMYPKSFLTILKEV